MKNQQSSNSSELILIHEMEKLTSQIFTFLIIYSLLVIALAIYGAKLAPQIKNILLVIPILGQVVHIWLNHKKVKNKASENGINISLKAWYTSGEKTEIFGIKGDASAIQGVMRLKTGVTKGGKIGLIDQSASEKQSEKLSSSEAFIYENFPKLNENNQQKMMIKLLDLIENQEKKNNG